MKEKQKIDWAYIELKYINWLRTYYLDNDLVAHALPHPALCFDWLKKRIEKELNSSQE